jgi:AcrR family transcriptional regulator
MTRSPRKQQEIEAREKKILEVAAKMFLESGYHGLNMDEIAREIGCAKGTVYGHFRNKEDILMEMASQGVNKRAEMFSKAAAFTGRPRVRMAVLGMSCQLFVRAFPHYFAAEIILRTETLREKAAPQRQEFMRACESRCMQILAGIVRDAVAAGDLSLPEESNAEELTFGLWSLTYGGFTLLETGTPLQNLGIRDPYRAVFHNAHLMLDGIGWKPLSTELDYLSINESAMEELFPHESRVAGLVPTV